MATLVHPASEKTDLANEPTFEERLAVVVGGAQARLDAELDRMRRLGVIDENGDRVKTELPADMVPGSDRDFGG
jgi:hypothetical protein